MNCYRTGGDYPRPIRQCPVCHNPISATDITTYDLTHRQARHITQAEQANRQHRQDQLANLF